MKSVLLGLSLFVTLHVTYLCVVAFASWMPPVFVWFPYLAALLASLVVGALLKQAKPGHFIAMGCAMAACVCLLNVGWSSSGFPADFHGLSGSLLVAALSLPFLVILAVVGGVLGVKLYEYKHR